MSYFTPAGSGGAPQNVTVNGATTPLVVNVSILLAATEYSYVLPTDCKQFLIKLRNSGRLQVSYSAGQSGITYLTVPSQCFYAESDLALTAPTTIYFQSNLASQIAELQIWT